MGEHLLGIDKKILWLDISMNHVIPVTVFDRLEQLVNVVAHLV